MYGCDPGTRALQYQELNRVKPTFPAAWSCDSPAGEQQQRQQQKQQQQPEQRKAVVVVVVVVEEEQQRGFGANLEQAWLSPHE